MKVPGPDIALIADSEPIDNRRELLDSRDMRRPDIWRKFSGPLSVRLIALHAEVIAAIGETKARASRPPAPKEQTFGLDSMGTFLTSVQQTGFGGSGSAATQASPAVDAGALPDLAVHGV